MNCKDSFPTHIFRFSPKGEMYAQILLHPVSMRKTCKVQCQAHLKEELCKKARFIGCRERSIKFLWRPAPQAHLRLNNHRLVTPTCPSHIFLLRRYVINADKYRTNVSTRDALVVFPRLCEHNRPNASRATKSTFRYCNAILKCAPKKCHELSENNKESIQQSQHLLNVTAFKCYQIR